MLNSGSEVGCCPLLYTIHILETLGDNNEMYLRWTKCISLHFCLMCWQMFLHTHSKVVWTMFFSA